MMRSTPHLPEAIGAAFAFQAKACRDLASPFTASVCEALAQSLDENSAFGRRIWSWGARAKADALALRAAGALHFLARSGEAPRLAAAYPPNAFDAAALASEIARAIETHDDFLAGFLDRPPQTNEAGRSSVILGGALIVAAVTGLPLETFEIGASAGLNLHFDRYAYDLRGGAFGARSAAPSPLLRLARRGACARRRIADRRARGLRRRSARSRRRGTSRAAARLCLAGSGRTSRPHGESARPRGGASRARRARRRRRLARCASFDAARAKRRALRLSHRRLAISAAGDEALRHGGARGRGASATRETPLALLQMEADGDTRSAALTLTLWPGGESFALGRADFHGRWAEWSGAGPHRPLSLPL